MLYVEPAGGNPDIFNRGFKMVFFAQQATADHQGDVWANWIAALPEDKRPKTAAYPTLDDPFTTPTSEGIEAILKAAGDRDRLPQDLHGRHDELRLDRQRGQGQEPRPRRRRHAVRGRRRLRARARQGRLHAEVALPDQRAVVRRPVRRGRRRREHRGRVLRGQPQPGGQDARATRSSSPSTRRCSAARRCPRTRPTRTRRREVLQATVEANKTVEKADQLKLADWLRANSVDDDPRHAELERGRQPEGRVPGRPVAERQARDRAAGGRGDDRHDHRGLQARRGEVGETLRRRPSPGAAAARQS